jgi:LCP family protein required for cell wall assembly
MSFQTRRIREEKPPRLLPGSKKAASVLRASLPLWKRFQAWRAKRKEARAQKKRVTILKRITVVLLSVLLALVLIAGVTKALVSLKVVSLRTFLNVTGTELKTDSGGYVNVLLLGRGDADHDGVDLTDTMMIASTDPKKTKSTILLSIPRDLYVTDSQSMGRSRINELYRNYKTQLHKEGLPTPEASKKALEELMAEVGRKFNVRLQYAIIVNFSGFVKGVDALGGVDIDVPYDIMDTTYPGPNYSYETFEIKAGPQHLDGETALKYVRSRHTTSDFGRSARQQQVIQALSGKAKTMGIIGSPAKILSLYRILSENIETTMSTSEMLGGAKLAEDLDASRVITMQLNDRSGVGGGLPEPGGFLYDPPRAQFGGASVLLPYEATFDPVPGTSKAAWTQLQTFASLLVQNRSLYLSHPRIAILNAGAKPGMAARLGGELIRYGFSVETMENATGKPKIDASFIALQTEADRPAAGFFSSLLKLPLPATPPMALDAAQQQQVTIVLGKDFSYKSIVDLLKANGRAS